MRFQYFELLMLFANQLCYLAISNRPLVQVQYCFKPTDTIRPIRDGEPRTATSTFTQLLNSDTWCVHPLCPLKRLRANVS